MKNLPKFVCLSVFYIVSSCQDARWPASAIPSRCVRTLPRGGGIVSSPVPKKPLQMGGIEDCYPSAKSPTDTFGNFGWVGRVILCVWSFCDLKKMDLDLRHESSRLITLFSSCLTRALHLYIFQPRWNTDAAADTHPYPHLRKDRLHQVVFPGEYWSPFVSRCWWLKMAKLSGFRTSWRSVPLNQVGREPAEILQMEYLFDFSKHTA